MKKDYKNIIPQRFYEVSYENDVPELLKGALIAQLQARNGLLMSGKTGVGKTHVACAMAKYILDQGFDVLFYNTGKFLELLREEFGKEDEEKHLFRDMLEFKGVIILDDIGAEKPSAWAIERLYLIINEKYESMTPMIFTTNCEKEALMDTLGDRIVSRITGMTLTVRIPGQDRRTN